MSTPATVGSVTVRRRLRHPREAVFAAWTDPDSLARWFGGSRARTLSVAVDLRVGGAYRLTVENAGEVAAVEGVYEEVVPPERLAFTWRWDRADVDGGRESRVVVDFLERGETTEVVVTHTGLSSAGSQAFHDEGWTRSLAELDRELAPEPVADPACPSSGTSRSPTTTRRPAGRSTTSASRTAGRPRRPGCMP